MEKWTEAEVAQIRGRLRQRQEDRSFDREDKEVFDIIHGKPTMSEGCIRIILEVGA